MSRNRQTVFIPEAEVGQAITSPSLTSKPTFRTEDAAALSISHKSPWEYYEKRFPMKFWCSFAIITSKPHRGGDPRMMRTLTGAKSDEQLQIIRHIFHRNIVQNIELFASGHEPGSYFIVSEYMPTSLSHLYGCPEYPSEPAFSSILYQILSAIEFLCGEGLVHEAIACTSVLMTFSGEVKIGDIECCRRGGDFAKFLDSFNRIAMVLMDKRKTPDAAIGLTRIDKWSGEAVDFFTSIRMQAPLTKYLNHSFMSRRSKEELKWLVLFVMVSAEHSRV
ncbi:hypothetical protein Purlil1_12259 [Purpureocillium lilacinum]|uniref:cyclin-dependent kinase n=1 Tax=Purpureocillium lilacinum TaxID=33203 RepID=A0ABR0BHI9_PURLI|nr:hypothetical protein Purlil1_12259 [Purpureocillium lilacinum]